MSSKLLFSTFEVTTQAFYRASLSYAIVNLKPIVPGHVLVIPNRNVPRITDLNDDELACMMRSIKRVGSVIQKVYGANALTIACQDGVGAGQSVPHVHFHLLPRKSTDPFAGRNDDIYPELEKTEGNLASDMNDVSGSSRLKVDADEDRAPRSLRDMEEEAAHLRRFFTEAESP
ncbi:Bis(5'-nucleosyl)-tetraphosphatase [asymmetrical] [Psilocybe cubensis]|uniref:HIT domain-containing protein n=2 Tax=Psilocybe cubensis TaxID=181762 RepID=A0A8H7Y6T8_PSICU|nr:Bis(5'-nucleosyl)-tetraphosphatase [asymmetrical] [Psilocybe cubensis]KAH9486378.1 Bis(5'-nucleosyl)-tetraphosphatase [asymmetrical] [Psilocybe cubensis]